MMYKIIYEMSYYYKKEITFDFDIDTLQERH